MYGVFSRFCASMSKWKLYEEAQQQRLMIGIVSTPEDLAKNPQLAHAIVVPGRGARSSRARTVRYAGPPYRLSATPWSLRRRPPLPGEHNAEVFGELGCLRPGPRSAFALHEGVV